MTLIQQITNHFTMIGFYLTLFLNSLLIYLTVFHIRQIVVSYKYMIVTFASLGIVFVSWEQVAMPTAHNFNASFVYFSADDDSQYSYSSLKFALEIYAAIYSSLIAFTAIQFSFRHLVMTNSKFLEKLRYSLVVLVIGYVILFGALFGGSLAFFGEPDAYDDEYLREELRDVYNLEVTKIPRFILIPYGSNGELRLKSFFCAFGCLTVISIQYLIVIYCAVQMRANIHRELNHCSKHHRTLEKQFFKALLVQISLPTFLFTLPSFPVLFFPFLDAKISVQTGFIYAVFSFYTPLDSLCFMCIVSEYPERMRGIIVRFKTEMLTDEGIEMTDLSNIVI